MFTALRVGLRFDTSVWRLESHQSGGRGFRLRRGGQSLYVLSLMPGLAVCRDCSHPTTQHAFDTPTRMPTFGAGTQVSAKPTFRTNKRIGVSKGKENKDFKRPFLPTVNLSQLPQFEGVNRLRPGT
jgi:hypothetical protein